MLCTFVSIIITSTAGRKEIDTLRCVPAQNQTLNNKKETVFVHPCKLIPAQKGPSAGITRGINHAGNKAKLTTLERSSNDEGWGGGGGGGGDLHAVFLQEKCILFPLR